MKSALAHRASVRAEQNQHARLVGLKREKSRHHEDADEDREQPCAEQAPKRMAHFLFTRGDGTDEQSQTADQQQDVDWQRDPSVGETRLPFLIGGQSFRIHGLPFVLIVIFVISYRNHMEWQVKSATA